MLAVAYLWHCLCFLTPTILLSSYPWLMVRYPVPVLLWLLRTMLLCGYVVSPLIFLALNSDYQNGVKRFLNCLPGRIDDEVRAQLTLRNLTSTRKQVRGENCETPRSSLVVPHRKLFASPFTAADRPRKGSRPVVI
ncbi:hypothetical protein BV898_01294 [Hypsibius exemplaris]|uniref:G-protein coupled receptors family 1 profile domain-containing protein n=1 Tax=Hypsibius exemplaris TaxID=2072580 RepID=A0A1W0XBK2_HYPEX|nr:hypothetical protein BV898_01294 [Hypsibius exemplaris]